MSTNANSIVVSKIYKSRNIILDLLKKRGFDTNDYEGFSINEVHIMNNNKQLDLLLTNPDTNKKVYVCYRHSKKIGAPTVHEIVDEIFNIEELLTKDDELVIVTKFPANDTIRKLLKHLYNTERIFINIYNIDNYLFNVLDNELVPKHRVLDNEEKAMIYKQYNIREDSQVAELPRFDPVAMAIGARPKQLVEIIRPSASAGTSIFYRLCKG